MAEPSATKVKQVNITIRTVTKIIFTFHSMEET